MVSSIFLIDHFSGQNIRLGIRALPIEGTEVADGGADIAVVDVAVDIVRAIGFGVEPAANAVSGPAYGCQIATAEQRYAFIRRDALPSTAFCKIRVMVEFNFNPLAGQSTFAG